MADSEFHLEKTTKDNRKEWGRDEIEELMSNLKKGDGSRIDIVKEHAEKYDRDWKTVNSKAYNEVHRKKKKREKKNAPDVVKPNTKSKSNRGGVVIPYTQKEITQLYNEAIDADSRAEVFARLGKKFDRQPTSLMAKFYEVKKNLHLYPYLTEKADVSKGHERDKVAVTDAVSFAIAQFDDKIEVLYQPDLYILEIRGGVITLRKK